MLKIWLSCAVSIACISLCIAQQPDSRSLKEKQVALKREMNVLQQSLDNTRNDSKASLGQLALIRKKIQLREQMITVNRQQVYALQKSIANAGNEIARLKNELAILKELYSKSVVYAYKNRSSYDFLNFIFSAASFNDALKRVEYLRSYRTYREQQAVAIKETGIALQQKITLLRDQQKEKDAVLQKQQTEKLALLAEQKEKDKIVSRLKAREKQLTKELAAKAKADRELVAGINAAIRREHEKKKRMSETKKTGKTKAAAPSIVKAPAKTTSGNASTLTAGGEVASENFEKNRGKLPCPVDKSRIKLPFGPYKIPELKDVYHNNPGLTLETEKDAQVKAVFDGVVSAIFDVDGQKAVIIMHGSYFTTYSNLAAISVAPGQQVKTGDLLGKAAVNEQGIGEIDFLVTKDKIGLDPELWIRKN